jgi:monoamine oxidase
LNPDFDVVIVGGGAAGIGAARRLAGSGLRTCLLEAGTRLGGRAWTQELGGLTLDMGCGWLHSAERNAWAAIASATQVPLNRARAAWGVQFGNLGFSVAEQAAAWQVFEDWTLRLRRPTASDVAADALDARCEWNTHLRAIVSFISGARLENLSAADYVAYDDASSDSNWRLESGLGALIASSMPEGITVKLGTAVEALALTAQGMQLTTAAGTLEARGVILTVSTAVLAGDSIKLPAHLDSWREAATQLPLGLNEKLFLEITGPSPFEPETHVTGNPRDEGTASFYIRPFGRQVIECFLGGARALWYCDQGVVAGFEFALSQLASLFGADVRRVLRPLTASAWGRAARIGGAYSYALPGCAGARQVLARGFDNRVFFAGEATHTSDFSTAHGAHDSGERAAGEVLQALLPAS